MADRRRRLQGTVGAVAVLALVAIVVTACGVRPPSRTTTVPAPRTTTTPSPSEPSQPSEPSATATPTPSGPTGTPTPSPTPDPKPLRLLGLGDSVPAADACGCRGFLEQASDVLTPLIGRSVRLHNDAVAGWTTSSVLDSLRSGAARQDLASGADLVVIEAGANDLPLGRITDPACQPVQASPCFRPILTAVGQALTTAVTLIRRTDPAPNPRVVLMGYWNVSVDGVTGRRRGQTYMADSRALTVAFNQVVRQVAARTGAVYVDAYTPLLGPNGGRDPSPYLLGDGDHPNRAGYRLLVDALVAKLKWTGDVAAWSVGQ